MELSRLESTVRAEIQKKVCCEYSEQKQAWVMIGAIRLQLAISLRALIHQPT